MENPFFSNIVDVDVSRTVRTNGQVTVNYNVQSSNPEAIVGEDISQETGSITFLNNKRNATIQLLVFNDNIPEDDEDFLLVLTSATKGDKVIDNKVRITIQANDAPIRFAQVVLSNTSVDVLMEPDEARVYINGNDLSSGILSLQSQNFISAPRQQVNEDKDSNAVFTVIHTGSRFGVVSVTWEFFRNDSFSAVDLDITPVNGTVTFDSGEHGKRIILNIVQDLVPEPAEGLTLRLVKGSETGGGEVQGICEDVLEATAISTVTFAGEQEMIEHIHLLQAAFIQVG